MGNFSRKSKTLYKIKTAFSFHSSLIYWDKIIIFLEILQVYNSQIVKNEINLIILTSIEINRDIKTITSFIIILYRFKYDLRSSFFNLETGVSKLKIMWCDGKLHISY